MNFCLTYNSVVTLIFAVDLSQRKGINIAVLIRVIEKVFKLLDDIDTASDIFKPKWCKITQVVEKLQRFMGKETGRLHGRRE